MAEPTSQTAAVRSCPRVGRSGRSRVVKSGESAPRAVAEFDPKHVGLFDAIRDGYDYALFWTNDPADPIETSVRETFTAAVQAIRADANVQFIFADRIERLCYANFAVLVQSPALPLAGVVSLRTWGSRQDFTIPFQADADRVRYIEALRARARTENATSAATHLFGDTGVGKSRLIYEALFADDLEQRVLVAPDPAHFDRSLLSLVAESAERRLILVVDNCTYQDRQTISQFADLARGSRMMRPVHGQSGLANPCRAVDRGDQHRAAIRGRGVQQGGEPAKLFGAAHKVRRVSAS